MQERVDSSQIEVSTKQSLAATAQQAELKEDQALYFIPSADMPLELAFLILSFLDVKSWRLAAQVCRSWHLLANDSSLWRSQEAYYKQGNLWRYLFKEPNTSSYQKYFTEVMLEPTLDHNNVFDCFRSLRDKIFKSAVLFPPTSDKHKVEKIKILINNYFEGIYFDRMQTCLPDLPTRISQLSPLVREKCLAVSPTSWLIEDDANRSLALALLVKTHSLDISLVELLYLNKLRTNYTGFIQDFVRSPIGKLYENRKAIYLLFALENPTLLEQAPATALVLLGKLSANELLECAQYCREPLTLFILSQPTLTNSVDDNQLFTFFSDIGFYRLYKNFTRLLEQNRALLPRLSADFLIRLCDNKEDNAKYLPFLILTHSILLQGLSLDQITKLINDAKKLRSPTIQDIFSNEVFQSYVAKLKNPRAFLLSLPRFEALYQLDWTAALLIPEDALNAVTNAAINGQSSLLIAKAVAKQPILIDKFNSQQLIELADEHPEVALILLRNEKLINWWPLSTLEWIRGKAKDQEFESEIQAEIIKIRDQQIECQRQKHIEKQTRQLEQSYTTHNYIASKLKISRPPSTRQEQSAQPPFLPMGLPPAKPPVGSKMWPLVGLIGLSLLFTLSALLLLTGYGGIVGAPLLLMSFTAINIFPISTSTLCLAAFLTGACTTILSGTLTYGYGTRFLSKKASLERQIQHISRPHAADIRAFRQEYSLTEQFKLLNSTAQDPQPALSKKEGSFASGPRF